MACLRLDLSERLYMQHAHFYRSLNVFIHTDSISRTCSYIHIPSSNMICTIPMQWSPSGELLSLLFARAHHPIELILLLLAGRGSQNT